MTHREIFTDIYQRRVWGDGSGGGSAPGVAGPWAAIASKVIAELKPRTVLDIGCGDGWASAGIDLHGAAYLGIDPVDSIVEYCRETHIVGNRNYLPIDAITQVLPDADLVLVKEVTQHLSDASVLALIEKLRRYPAVLHCSAVGFEDDHEDIDNYVDIPDGGFRPCSLWTRATGGSVHFPGRFHSGGTHYFTELWRPA